MFGISGLVYIENYVTESEEDVLLDAIEQGAWLGGQRMQRRVQHYGWQYAYLKKQVDASMYLGPLPDWLSRLGHRLALDGLLKEIPDQAIVNEYTTKSSLGIGKHVDCPPCFNDGIASLSLLSEAPMIFRHPNYRPVTVYLKPRALLVLHGPARYAWTHEIPKARTYQGPNGDRRQRHTRYSLTFRRVIVNP